MVSTDQSMSESETGSTTGSFGERSSKKTTRINQRKSAVPEKTIKDRIFCVIFCCFNHVRNSRSGDR